MPDEAKLHDAFTVIGSEDIAAGFKALGFKTYSAKERGELEPILRTVFESKAGICLIQDELYLKVQDIIDSYKSSTFPIIIPFSKDGEAGELDNLVREIRLRATGRL